MSTASPLVSVLLSAHDAGQFLRPALESVLRQTVTDLELLVVDDGSTDATSEILESVGDRRLVVLRNDERLGLAASLNSALDHARGRYVARLDADDVALPWRLERQLGRIEAEPRPAIVGSAVLELSGGDRPGELHLMPNGPVAVRWASLFSSPFFHPTVLFDRRLLESDGLRYDTEFEESEDYDLWTRLLRVGTGDNLTEPLVLYRVHPGQASSRRRDVQRDFQRRVALREIAAAAPGLTSEQHELAWQIGAGEELDSEKVEDAADAFVELVHAFEATEGTDMRETAARSLLAAGRRAGGGAGARALVRALELDPALLLHATSRRARRLASARNARRGARSWLAQLQPPSAVGTLSASPIRVTAVFPEPTPYRAPLLDRVASLPELDLTVVYAAETVADRTWTVQLRHHAVFLDGFRVPGARPILRHDYPLNPGIARALVRSRPDVVVVSGWSTFAAQAAIAWCRLRRIPYVLVVESHDEGPRSGWRRAIKRTVVPSIVRGASGALVTGSLARRSMLSRGAAPESVRVFANTVDVEAFGERADRLAARRSELRADLGAGPEDVLVLSVGRLAPEKGMEQLVRAVAAAGDARVLLVVAGEGPERTHLEDLARSLGARLVLAGDRPWERIVEVYVAADVFALLSEQEPWGVVVNEAAACGLPLVLSDRVGAAHDLLRDGENGYLVPAGDGGSAVEALRRLAGDPALRRSFGASSRDLAREWGYGPSVAGFLAAVQEAVAKPRR